MEDVQADVAALDLTRPDLPLDRHVRGHPGTPGQRTAFLDELQRTLRDLFTRYGGADGDAFRLAVACYPKEIPMIEPDLRLLAVVPAPPRPCTRR